MKAIFPLLLCLSLVLTACSDQSSQESDYDTTASNQVVTDVQSDVVDSSLDKDMIQDEDIEVLLTLDEDSFETPSVVNYDTYVAELNSVLSSYGFTKSLDNTTLVTLDDSVTTQVIKVYDTDSNGNLFIGTVEDDDSILMVSVCWLGWNLSSEVDVTSDMQLFNRYSMACALCLNENISEIEMQNVWTELNAMSAMSTTPSISDSSNSVFMQLNMDSADCISFIAVPADVQNYDEFCDAVEELAYISYTSKLNESFESKTDNPVAESIAINTTKTIQTEEEFRLFLKEFFDNYYIDYLTMSNTFSVQWLKLISVSYFNDEMDSEDGIQGLSEFAELCNYYTDILSYFEDVTLSEEVGSLTLAGNKFSYMTEIIDDEFGYQKNWVSKLLIMSTDNKVPYNTVFESSGDCPTVNTDAFPYLLRFYEFIS